MVSQGDVFGFLVAGLCVDFSKAMAAQKRARSETLVAVENRLVEWAEGRVFRGFSKFGGKHEVTIGKKNHTKR